MAKTNAMRRLDSLGIAYESAALPPQKTPPGAMQAAALLGVSPECVYKTLVAQAAGGGCCVFVVAAAAELNLKKAARAAGAKSVWLIDSRELVALTGYQKGGVSPIGMKKQFPSIIDQSANSLGEMFVSAGQIGLMLRLAPADLARAANAAFFDVQSPHSIEE